MISYQNISITLGQKKILSNISLEIKEGEIFCIVGRSGVGKSVMIKQLVGLLYPTSGNIFFMGKNISKLDEKELSEMRKDCQMVFQHATLFDSMSCLDNVSLPILKHQKIKPNKARDKAFAYMSEVGIDHLAYKDPSTLGPGQRKLVAITRALTMNPKAILFDEPTTGLDPLAARKFDKLVKGPLAKTGLTQVIVTHDVRSIFEIAQKIALLHEGRLKFLGSKEELETCTDPVVQGFIRGLPSE